MSPLAMRMRPEPWICISYSAVALLTKASTLALGAPLVSISSRV